MRIYTAPEEISPRHPLRGLQPGQSVSARPFPLRLLTNRLSTNPISIQKGNAYENKLIAWDLGTGGVKASLFNTDGASLAETFRPYDTLFPQEKWVEQRPLDWWEGVCAATASLLQESGCNPAEIACAALSDHSLVAAPLDRTGRLLSEQVPIWCDMRASDQVPAFFRDLSYEDWYLTTGNGDPPETYTILKLMWMREHQPELSGGTAVELP